MSYSKAILNIQSRINTLEKEYKQVGQHPNVPGLREAIRILKSIDQTNLIDPYLQTR